MSDAKYRRTKKGVIAALYYDQRGSSVSRGHPYPAYSKKDFYDWIMSQPDFHHIYHLWRISNFDSMLKPSVDRLDDFEPYTFSNIRVVTWFENRRKQWDDIRNGTGTSGKAHCKSVIQYTTEGILVREYHSAAYASRESSVSQFHISSVCRGARRSAGGYIWRFKYENKINGNFAPDVKTTKKPVLQFDKSGNFVAEYDSAIDAERKTGAYHSKIAAVCKGKRKTTGGYIWKYKNKEQK